MREARFNDLFDEWAATYDQTVYDKSGEYQEVFANYDQILSEVVSHIPEHCQTVLEVGVGTGNLSRLLLQSGYSVIGVEPSEQMRKQLKIKELQFDVRDGHFLNLPLQPEETVDAVVSSFAFHHLTLEEKRDAIRLMKQHVTSQGSVIFADTAFQDESSKQHIIKRVRAHGHRNLLQDLLTEYYEHLDDLRAIFQENGFHIECKQLNQYVWLLVAKPL